MSAEQTRRTLNQIDKELADLEKKMADLMKKEADKSRKISDTNRSITKNTSPSTAQSKQRQIQSLQSELARVLSDKADINKRIADKRGKRGEIAVRLQKEEAAEFKKAEKAQIAIHNGYEKRVKELSTQLTRQALATPSITKTFNNENNLEKFDVFLSHASEDKASFADELCKALEKRAIRVWYDALNIAWGDSLRAAIDNGLKKSKYGIVVISKDYIRKGWTQYELDGLFQIEMTNGKTILPVWHNITKDEVMSFSPTLAGRKALTTSMLTATEIANELCELLGFEVSPEEENEAVGYDEI